jgi:O-antigen/teichoic acid export membrane protein
LSKIKQLAGQTLWYGGSSIAARFLNYLLTPFLTDIFSRANYGVMGLIYAAIPILNVVFTYGMETAFFRFARKEEGNEKDVYNTIGTSIIISTIVLGGTLLIFYKTVAVWAGVADLSGLIFMSILIIMLDTLSAIPFAKLRLDGKPKKYALIKVIGIVVNIFFTLFFLWFCPRQIAKDPGSICTLFYDADKNGVFYVVLANLFQAAITYLFLFKEVMQMQLKIDVVLWKKIMLYSMPLILAGLGGVVNETFDRRMLEWLVPGSAMEKREQIGIYNACYKISILITLFIQAFRMGAEPFFFKESSGKNPQKVYARVMKFFVIVVCMMFLFVAFYLPIWKYFIDEKFWIGLSVVPILLLANLFLGIYLNLSIWYKLGHKTIVGAYITLVGTIVTLSINYMFIPTYGYTACAWATLACYGTMMLISYLWGKKVYPIPYAWKKLLAYIVLVILLYGLYAFLHKFILSDNYMMVIGTILFAAYIFFIGLIERQELIGAPVIGKYFLPKSNKKD